MLYPAGWTTDDLTYQATLRLPEGWKFGTPLPIASQSGTEIKFNPSSLTTLVDSPVIAGQYFRVVPLSENPRQEMDIAADSAGDLDCSARSARPLQDPDRSSPEALRRAAFPRLPFRLQPEQSCRALRTGAPRIE